MRRSALKEFADSLAFVRRHRCDINKSLHATNTTGPLTLLRNRCRVAASFRQRTQWDLRGNGLQSSTL